MRSGDITRVTGVPELTWCYNCNNPSGTCATLYMLESILTTLGMEQKMLQEQGG